MADLTTFRCRLSCNQEASTSWNPQGLSRDCSTYFTVQTCLTCNRLLQGTKKVTSHENQSTPSAIFWIAVAVFHFTFMSGIQEESYCISTIVVAFPFQFISRTPHTCNSSAINLVVTKKVRILYMKTEVRFLLYLGWFVRTNSYPVHWTHTLRTLWDSLRKGNDYVPCPRRQRVPGRKVGDTLSSRHVSHVT